MKYGSLLIGLLAFLNPVMAQNNKEPLATTYYRKGEEALLKGKYKRAVRHFNNALLENPNLLAARRGMGVGYEMMNEHTEALEQYMAIIEADSFFSRNLYYQVGELLFKSGRAREAIDYFQRFRTLQDSSEIVFSMGSEAERKQEEEYLRQLPGSIRACEISLDSLKFRDVADVVNLGKNINSKADEYFPFISNDQTLLLYTRRRNDSDDEDLYYSRAQDEAWRNGSPVGSGFNSRENEGMSTMVRDGRRIFFTACNREGVAGPCDLWQADMRDLDFYNIKSVEGLANSELWESQAAVSCDGSILYFASNRPGGLGGTDIWFTVRLPTGLWSAPTNMGPKINTPYDEEAPFITNDGRTLYFSSTGHLGMGDQDIFMSFKDVRGYWSEPVNLGPPVNTPFRELGFVLSADGTTGYFASNREGGYGGMDIYKFRLSEQLYSEPITFVELFARDSITGDPVSNALLAFDHHPNVRTDEEGRAFICIPGKTDLSVSANHEAYHPYGNQYYIPISDNRDFFTINLPLRPIKEPARKVVEEEPREVVPGRRIRVRKQYQHVIYFKFDSYLLEPDESTGLNTFLRELREKDIRHIEIFGYADDVGDERYNLELSEQRAKTIAMHLVEQQIAIENLTLRGWGEVDNDRPKEENRRVEIKISTLE